nr:Coupling protein TraD [Chlamydiota bacterium]
KEEGGGVLKEVLQGFEELGCQSSIDDTMVGREDEGHLLARNYASLSDNSHLFEPPDSENGGLWGVDHSGKFSAGLYSFISPMGGRILGSKIERDWNGGEPMYNSTGMIFGADSAMDISRYQITDGDLANNLHSFTKQCLLYDITLGRYTLDEIKKASDLWKFFEENTSKVRIFPFYPTGEYLSCKQAIQKMTPLFEKEKGYYGQLDACRNLPLTYQALTGMQKEREELISQQLMMNVLLDEYGGNSFASERAHLQQRSTYQTLGVLASSSLVTLRAVIEALVYAAFIFILPLSVLPGGVKFLSTLLFFFLRGRATKKKQHISGKKQISPTLLKIQLHLKRKASPIKIGPMPLLKGIETQHILVTGGTGTGKTNSFHHILPQIRSQKTIILDPTGLFVEKYFDPTQDILLNPFDPRTAPWHPWSECTTIFDYDTLAENLIPQTLSDHENYWRTAARTLLSILIQKLSDTKRTSELPHWLLYQPLDKLAEFLEGTKAAAHIDIHSEKTAASIRSVAAAYLTCLEHLPDTTTPFSIKTWIQDPSPGWLFLYTKPSERATLDPLLSSWFSTATRSFLSLSPDLKRRIWFIIDELSIFQKLQALDSLITEGRKYGAWRPPSSPKPRPARRDLWQSRLPNNPRELRHPPHLCRARPRNRSKDLPLPWRN